ncbi:MAG: hypothetical protein AAGH65_11345, partial [Pseudomonadota bacterium]
PDGTITDTFNVTVVGIMDNASFVPDDFDTEAVTSYAFSFTSSSVIQNADLLILENIDDGNDNNDPDYASATFGSISGGTLTGEFAAAPDGDSFNFVVQSGIANPGDVITLRINDVVNPFQPGLGSQYAAQIFKPFNSPPVIQERTTIAGTTYSDGGLPQVIQPIADQTLFEADGQAVVIDDLNTVFQDGNGQALTFSVLPGNDDSIASVQVNVNQLTISPVGPGITTVQVQASDLPAGGTGTISDAFDVRVIGELDNVAITPMDNEVNQLSSYSVTFNTASEVLPNYLIVLEVTGANGPDFSSANLDSLSGGTLAGMIGAQSANELVLIVDSGSATTNALVEIELSSVLNPSADGVGPAYQIDVLNSADLLLDRGRADGSSYFDPDLLFRDSFELQALIRQ